MGALARGVSRVQLHVHKLDCCKMRAVIIVTIVAAALAVASEITEGDTLLTEVQASVDSMKKRGATENDCKSLAKTTCKEVLNERATDQKMINAIPDGRRCLSLGRKAILEAKAHYKVSVTKWLAVKKTVTTYANAKVSIASRLFSSLTVGKCGFVFRSKSYLVAKANYTKAIRTELMWRARVKEAKKMIKRFIKIAKSRQHKCHCRTKVVMARVYSKIFEVRRVTRQVKAFAKCQLMQCVLNGTKLSSKKCRVPLKSLVKKSLNSTTQRASCVGKAKRKGKKGKASGKKKPSKKEKAMKEKALKKRNAKVSKKEKAQKKGEQAKKALLRRKREQAKKNIAKKLAKVKETKTKTLLKKKKAAEKKRKETKAKLKARFEKARKIASKKKRAEFKAKLIAKEESAKEAKAKKIAKERQAKAARKTAIEKLKKREARAKKILKEKTTKDKIAKRRLAEKAAKMTRAEKISKETKAKALKLREQAAKARVRKEKKAKAVAKERRLKERKAKVVAREKRAKKIRAIRIAEERKAKANMKKIKAEKKRKAKVREAKAKKILLEKRIKERSAKVKAAEKKAKERRAKAIRRERNNKAKRAEERHAKARVAREKRAKYVVRERKGKEARSKAVLKERRAKESRAKTIARDRRAKAIKKQNQERAAKARARERRAKIVARERKRAERNAKRRVAERNAKERRGKAVRRERNAKERAGKIRERNYKVARERAAKERANKERANKARERSGKQARERRSKSLVRVTYNAWTGWINNMDHPMNYAVGGNFYLSGLGSYHNNHYEDRQFKVIRTRIGARQVRSQWTGWLNNMDRPMSYSCPGNQVIVGLISYHNNHTEDRRWRIKCAQFGGVGVRKGGWTGYLNNWDRPFYSGCGGRPLVGLMSYHWNRTEDRRWRMQCGSFYNRL